jgi:hypothetical protein
MQWRAYRVSASYQRTGAHLHILLPHSDVGLSRILMPAASGALSSSGNPDISSPHSVVPA